MKSKKNKFKNAIQRLLPFFFLIYLMQVTSCSSFPIKKDIAFDALRTLLKAYKAQDPLLLWDGVKKLYESIEIKNSEVTVSFSTTLLENRLPIENTVGLVEWNPKNARFIPRDTTFVLNGIGKAYGDAVMYIEPANGDDSLLRDVLIEADIVVEKATDKYSTIALGVRSEPNNWRGYSLQYLKNGIMKIVTEDDNFDLETETSIERFNEGDRYHMVLAIKGSKVFSAILDYQNGNKYKIEYDLSDYRDAPPAEGSRILLHTWKVKAKFNNVRVIAL
ncbi:hypothetical protein CEE37_08585 [candidate division LCP-89 bacterium B3_LCP]|uniref:Uncharacterized protein n=1 Tax=candidate division LCP-89 bacterium B3_LCP TaxID=2012998 RepID=A0A532UZI6_UNCL8|nr:MAG: hypothetical protein CEE37_08585 [candidate division LCP-89 bacterium B3_LCP]